MVTRWEVTKAVRNSDLPAASRLIMLTLADSAETGTAEIPPRFTPSVTVLARETGLDRRTVQRHLAALEAAGWVIRTRPDERAQWFGERVRYRLDLPSGMEPPQVAEIHQGGGTESPGGRQGATGVAAESPKGGGTVPPLKTDHSDQSQINVRSAAQAQPALTITQRSKRITDAYAAAEPLCKWPAVNAIVIKAIKSGRFSDEEIRDALLRLAEEGRPVTVDTLRIELQGMPPRKALAVRNGHHPPPSTADQRVAAALALVRRFAEEER